MNIKKEAIKRLKQLLGTDVSVLDAASHLKQPHTFFVTLGFWPH